MKKSDVAGQEWDWIDARNALGLTTAIGTLVRNFMTTNLSKPMILSGIIFMAAWLGTDSIRITDGSEWMGNLMISEAAFVGLAQRLMPYAGKPVATSIGREAWGVITSYAAILSLILLIETLEDKH